MSNEKQNENSRGAILVYFPSLKAKSTSATFNGSSGHLVINPSLQTICRATFFDVLDEINCFNNLIFLLLPHGNFYSPLTQALCLLLLGGNQDQSCCLWS